MMNKNRPTKPGSPTSFSFIPLCVPSFHGNEWKYIKECLDTTCVSSVGSFVNRFEQIVAEFIGVKYAIAVTSGTTALHTALIVADIRPDEEVLVSTLTFIASANAVRYVGAWPVFVDADPIYWQIDIEKIADFLEKKCLWRNGALHNRTTGRRVSAILPVHILGHPVDMDQLLNVAQKYELIVVEDATESLGGKYKGKMVGSLGEIAVFSFNGNKIITAGGGGMIVTNNEQWAEKAKYLTTQAKDNSVEGIHGEIGYNYRLTNIQAALGVAQMECLEEYIKKKRRIALAYNKIFKDIPGIRAMPEAEWADSIFWMYTVLVDKKKFGLDSRKLLETLQKVNIQTRPLWQPLHLSPAHHGSQHTECSVAERLYRDALSLPSSVSLTMWELEYVAAQIISKAHKTS